MKKIIFLVIVLMTADTAFSQQASPTPAFINQDYLQKSKNQKKTAWIMLGGGATLVLTGIVFPKGEITRESFWGPEYKNDGIRGTLYFCGTLSMLGSIPFFIASGKNKKKAMSMSFKYQSVPELQNNSFVNKAVPSIRLTFKL